MIYLVDKNRLLSLFNVNKFSLLENAISSIAPSMCDYYLNELITTFASDTYLNKNNIEESIHIDLYSIYRDYDSNIYIESLNDNNMQTESLW